jgi:hypothetical protein
MEWVAKGDPGEAVSVQAPWATFYGARNNELLQRKIGSRITNEMSQSLARICLQILAAKRA